MKTSCIEVPTMTLSIRLPREMEQRLNALSGHTGRPRACRVREAIAAQLEDIHLGETALEDVRADRDGTHSLEEVEQGPGMDG